MRDADGPGLILLLLTPGPWVGGFWLLLTRQQREPTQAKQINCGVQSLGYAKTFNPFCSMYFHSVGSVPHLGCSLTESWCVPFVSKLRALIAGHLIGYPQGHVSIYFCK